MTTVKTRATTTLDDDAKRMLTLTVLERHYTNSEESTLYELVKILSQLKPILLHVGHYQLLINTKENFAFTNNLNKVISQFHIENENKTAHASFNFEVLSNEDFESISNEMRQNGAKRYALTSVLWQIYNESIPININYRPHKLLLKVQQMPNLSEIPSAPEYTATLLSNCMLEAKTLDELKSNFKNIHPNQLHRIFLLSLLSGIVDINVLADSLHKQNPSSQKHISDTNPKKIQHHDAEKVSCTETKKKPMLEYEKIIAETLAKFDNNIQKYQTKRVGLFAKKDAKKKNEGKSSEISRAKKTGFFARLLNKLGS